MNTKNLFTIFLILISVTIFFNFNNLDISLAQIPALSNDIVTPSNTNTYVNSGPQLWSNVSGNWQILNGILHGGTGNNGDALLTNIILSPVQTQNFSSISTTFSINDLNQTVANYASIVYSFDDLQNYEYAGINIMNGSIYAISYDINNGTTTTDPAWPGVQTNLSWSPGTVYNMTLVKNSNNNSLGLVVNDTLYYTKNMDDNSVNPSGNVGLHYGRINSIDFYDFTIENEKFDKANDVVPDSPIPETYITNDSQTILLEDMELTEGSYIPLYDSTPYQIINGHIAAKVPCNDDNLTEITVLVGDTPELNPIELEYVSTLSEGELCMYHGSLATLNEEPITDIVIQNDSTEDIDFPDTSSIIININEISRISQ